MNPVNINVLDRLVCDQIAAGEVVERPGSVVKEIVENALDAGATKILLEITGGGVSKIRVLDDGSGIDPDQVETAFLRHATSKISMLSDLDTVGTFGFRGEALPSIASVSKVTVRTRTKDSVAGTMLVIEGGEVVERREVGCPVGTEIEVCDLFYNTPARLKFLKRESTEAGHCAEALVRLAAVCPDVSFKMVSNGRTVRNLPRVEKIEERVSAMFTKETLAKGQGHECAIEVTAILGPPHRARAGAGSLFTYVNNRFMRDKTLLGALTRAFAGTLEHGRYPVGLISLKMEPGSFDVNVHPQKTEVRFADPQAIYRAVNRVVGEMVSSAVWSKGVVAEDAGIAEPEAIFAPSEDLGDYSMAGRLVPPPHSPMVPAPRNISRTEHNETIGSESSQTLETKDQIPIGRILSTGQSGSFSDMNYIGQAKGLYLILEDADELVLVDQHAAHERVTYERLRGQFNQGRVTSQRLLVPHIVDLGPADAGRIESLGEQLGKFGLEVSRSGPDRITVHAVPSELTEASPDRLLADMVLALEDGRVGSRGEIDDLAIATMACHGSMRHGRLIQQQEVAVLLEQMDNIDFAGHCPHGRPVLTRIPWREIQRRVGRS